jgi:hypothetical protein
MVHEGGCLCGAIRYRVEGESLSAGYCYCRMCQRAAGAPVVAWAAFRRQDFRFTKGEPHAVKASERAIRTFCAECGTALTFEYSGGTSTIDVTLASMDDPTPGQPLYEIWVSAKPKWLQLKTDGPHFWEDPPDTPGRDN